MNSTLRILGAGLALALTSAAATATPTPPAPSERARPAVVEMKVVEMKPVTVDGETQIPLHVVIPRTRFQQELTPTELSLLSQAGLLEKVKAPR
jgi:hypothetical protein